MEIMERIETAIFPNALWQLHTACGSRRSMQPFHFPRCSRQHETTERDSGAASDRHLAPPIGLHLPASLARSDASHKPLKYQLPRPASTWPCLAAHISTTGETHAPRRCHRVIQPRSRCPPPPEPDRRISCPKRRSRHAAAPRAENYAAAVVHLAADEWLFPQAQRSGTVVIGS